MAFDPDKYLAQKNVAQAPAFDPDSYLEKKSGMQVPTVEKEITFGDKAESALQGLGQAGSFGYLPQLQAAAEPITDKIFGLLSGKSVDDDRNYVQRRDANIREDLRKQQQAPLSYGAGQLAGSLATPVPGSGLIKGAGIGAKLGKAALGGAISGAAYNPGDVEGEISGLQLGDRFEQGIKGGALGAAAQGLGMGVQKGLDKWATKGAGLEKASNMSAVVQAGAQKGDIKKLMNKNQIDRVGKFLKDEGLVGAGKTYEDVYQGTGKILKEEGPKIGQIYSKVQAKIDDPKFLSTLNDNQIERLNKTNLSATQIASELSSKFTNELKGKAGGKTALSRINTELETLAELGDNPNIIELMETRKSYDDLINYDRSVQDMPLAQKYLKKTRDAIQQKIDDRINSLDNVVGGNDLGALKKANARYAGAATANNIAKQKVAGEESKMLLGLPELMVGTSVAGIDGARQLMGGDVGGLAESGAKGLLAGALLKGARRYGPGLTTTGLGLASKAVQNDPTGKAAGLLSGAMNPILNNPKELGSILDRMRRSGGFSDGRE